MTNIAPNFIRNIIENDLAQDKFKNRLWCGKPGLLSAQEEGSKDVA